MVHRETQTHIVRNCIFCDRDDAETLFTYTHDFLVRSRGMTDAQFRDIGWDRETTSSIVRCRQCGCNYVRDVFIIYEREAQRHLSDDECAAKLAKKTKVMSFENRQPLRYCRALADALLRHVARRSGGSKHMSLLDFGSSLSSFSLTARSVGFSPVVLYDPYLPENIDAMVSRRHPLNISFVRTLHDLQQFAPFDVITCQAAVEHFYDPNGELQRMRELLRDDGVLFITNPCEPLNERARLLAHEEEVTDPVQRRWLRKNYHIQHVNFPTPQQFSTMLQRAGFVEIPTLLFQPSVDSRGVGFENSVRAAKACALYALDVMRIPHRRKTSYFAVKR